MADGIVLLVELRNGDVVAVPFDSREQADRWEERMPYEIVGRPRVVIPRSLSIGAAMRKQPSAPTPKCCCDGGAYEISDHPFISNPECPIHGERPESSRNDEEGTR